MIPQTVDKEYGQVIRLRFPTRARETGQLTTLFQNAQGGVPTFELRKRSTGAVVANGAPTFFLNKTPGIHEIVWDSANSNDAAINEDYDLYITDGRVSSDGTTASWLDVTNEVPLSFSLQNTSAGFVLQRAVKVQTFTVDSVVSNQVFVASGENLVGDADHYHLQNIAWAPDAANFGAGYVIRNSADEGGGKVRITLQRPLVVTPVVGDAGWFLPEERPAEQYWCNIEPEWGPSRDKYVGQWYNGTKPVPAEDTPRVTVVRTSDNAVVVANQGMTLVANSNPAAYEYLETSNLILPDDIGQITMTATIDGALRIYSRVYPNPG